MLLKEIVSNEIIREDQDFDEADSDEDENDEKSIM
jgi:hypothetical protein